MNVTDVLKSFLDTEGRLTGFPAKRKRKLYALVYLAGKFDGEREYTEQEVNALLRSWHSFDDPATLRRELYDYHFLDRSPDGRCYRLSCPQPSPESLGL